MKTNQLVIFLLFSGIIFSSCEEDRLIDTEKPVIDWNIDGAFPINCDTLYFGENFIFKILFKDNSELGGNRAFSIDIHHNFDHHSHSTEVNECILNQEKEANNPLIFIEDFDIPSGLQEYETNFSISLPAGNNNGLFDEGDYHFFVSVSDKEGWSGKLGLSIKILHRE